MRATGFEDEAIQHLAVAEARLADLPIQNLRGFVEDFLLQVDTLSAKLHAGENVNLTFTVKIEMDPEMLEAYLSALRAYGAMRLRNS